MNLPPECGTCGAHFRVKKVRAGFAGWRDRYYPIQGLICAAGWNPPAVPRTRAVSEKRIRRRRVL